MTLSLILGHSYKDTRFFIGLRIKMPAGYEKMRDAFKRKGISTKAAKKKASKIWNSAHKGGETVGRGRK